MQLTSQAFTEGDMIPAKYTCDGENVSPPLAFADVPEGTESFALVMDDPDIPAAVKAARGIEVFDHWVVHGVPAETRALPEGARPGALGINGRGDAAYTGPCPPPQHEPKVHRYFFNLYALSGTPAFDTPPTKAELLAAISSMTLAEAELMGRYTRA